MRSRCNNPNRKDYKHYGARGITVCEEWTSFENFLKDLGVKPTPKHSLERIDNEKGYSKSNCRWEGIVQQRLNRRPFKTKNGRLPGARKTTHGSKYHASIRINGKSIYLGTFNTEQEAHERFLQERNKR